MIPIYFPFTCMSEPVAGLLAAVFDRIGVLSPSKKGIKLAMQNPFAKGWLSVIAPFDDEDTELDKIVQSYRAWADLHGEDRLKQFVTQKLQSSFFAESSAFKLLDEIRFRSRRSTQDSKPDPVQGGEKTEQIAQYQGVNILRSRILLLIAQEYDRQNWEIRQDLAAATSLERNFLKELHATDDGAMQNPLPAIAWPEDACSTYMLAERFAAWTCFLDQEAVSSFRIFVTTSEPVMIKMVQALPSSKPLATINKIGINPMAGPDTSPGIGRLWQKKLAQWLADQTVSVETAGSSAPPVQPAVQNGEPLISLKIYRTDKSPLQWFRRAAGITSHIQTGSASRAAGQATVLVSVSTD